MTHEVWFRHEMLNSFRYELKNNIHFEIFAFHFKPICSSNAQRAIFHLGSETQMAPCREYWYGTTIITSYRYKKETKEGECGGEIKMSQLWFLSHMRKSWRWGMSGMTQDVLSKWAKLPWL